MPNINLKNLAKELGVSISTVSKSLKDSHEISTETKERVVAYAKKIGYSPNPYAGFLRHHKSKTIALIAPELNNNYFIQAISGAETVAQEKDYHLLIYCTNDDFQKEASILKDLTNGRVDGVLISLTSNTISYDHINNLINAGIPVVFFDRVCHEIETAKVTTDDFTSGFNATEHLIKKGCKNIAFISASENLSICNKRKQGYLEALAKNNILENPNRIIVCDSDETNNAQKIKDLFQSNIKTDAVFASIERLALTTYNVCNELNINIPRDKKIICFSNLRTAALLNPSLTTITQPAFEMGKQAAIILFKSLEKKKIKIFNENIILKSELIERNSTK